MRDKMCVHITRQGPLTPEANCLGVHLLIINSNFNFPASLNLNFSQFP